MTTTAADADSKRAAAGNAGGAGGGAAENGNVVEGDDDGCGGGADAGVSPLVSVAVTLAAEADEQGETDTTGLNRLMWRISAPGRSARVCSASTRSWSQRSQRSFSSCKCVCGFILILVLCIIVAGKMPLAVTTQRREERGGEGSRA